MKKLLLYCQFIFLFHSMSAYNFVVEGFLTDQNSQPLVQHEVFSFCTDSEGDKKTTTNNNGYYQFVYQVDGAQDIDVILYAHHWRNSELYFKHQQLHSAPGTVQVNLQLFRDNSPAPACAANFIPYLYSSGHSLAFFNASMADSIISYHWDFGDGDQSNYSSPVHHYGLNQRFLVTLKIITLDGCSSEMSYLVVFNQDDDFSVDVQLEAVPLPEGKALLFQPLLGQSSYTMYETSINSGTANLWSVPANQTYLWISPDIPTEEYVYPTYFPSYYGSTLKWQNAQVVDYQNLPQSISLLNYPDPYFGNGEILGRVIRNDNPAQRFEYFYSLPDDSPGPDNNLVYSVKYSPFPCTIFLENDQHQTIAYQVPDDEGVFHFRHLPAGTYTLRTEIFKIPAQPFSITLDSQTPISPFYEINITNSSVFVSVDKPELLPLQVFPQPAQELLIVQIPEGMTNCTLSLYSLQGDCIQAILTGSENQREINVSSLSSGSYILELKHQEYILRKKIIKI